MKELIKRRLYIEEASSKDKSKNPRCALWSTLSDPVDSLMDLIGYNMCISSREDLVDSHEEITDNVVYERDFNSEGKLIVRRYDQVGIEIDSEESTIEDEFDVESLMSEREILAMFDNMHIHQIEFTIDENLLPHPIVGDKADDEKIDLVKAYNHMAEDTMEYNQIIEFILCSLLQEYFTNNEITTANPELIRPQGVCTLFITVLYDDELETILNAHIWDDKENIMVNYIGIR